MKKASNFLVMLIITAVLFYAALLVGKLVVRHQLKSIDIGVDKIAGLEDEDITKGLDFEDKQQDSQIEDKDIVLTVINKTADIRDYHSARGKVICTVQKDEFLKKIDYFQGWFRVMTTTGEIGWCYEKSVRYKKQEGVEDLFPDMQRAWQIDPTDLKARIIAKRRIMLPIIIIKKRVAPVRIAPSTMNRIVDKTYRGDLHYVYAYQDGWFEVLMPSGDFGWIQKEFVETIKDYDQDNDEIVFGTLTNFENMFKPLYKVQQFKQPSVKLLIGPEPEFSVLKVVNTSANLLSYGRSGKWHLMYDPTFKVAGWVHKNNLGEIEKYRFTEAIPDVSDSDTEELNIPPNPIDNQQQQLPPITPMNINGAR